MFQNLTRLALVLSAGLATTAHAQDSVLIGDYAGDRIVKVAFPAGSAQSHFLGTGMTGLNQTRGMTYGPDGNLYIASDATDTIIKIDGVTGTPIGTNGIFVTAAAGGLNQPMGLAFGPDGNLYVASFLTNAIYKYNGTNGNYIDTFVPSGSGTLAGPYGIAFHNGNLYVCSANNDKVLRYNGTTGAFIDEVFPAAQNGMNEPHGIVIDAAGRIYVSALSNAVYVKDPVNGFSILTSSATNAAVTNPHLMTLSPSGQLLVCCYNSSTVQRIDRLTGASLGSLLSGLNGLSSTISIVYMPTTAPCYVNCDNSTANPILNANDFQCFLNKFAAGCT